MELWDPDWDEHSLNQTFQLGKSIICGKCNTEMVRIDKNVYKCSHCGQNYHVSNHEEP